MNILTLTSSYPRFAGDPTAPFIESITRHVAARGHTVHLVLPEHRAWNRPHFEDGVHFHSYRYSPRRSWTPWGYSEALEAGTRIKRRLYPLAPVVLASALRTCAAVVSRESIDVVHAHWLVPNGLLGALASKRHGLPLVISLHGSDVAVAERARALGKVSRASLSRSAAVTGPSRTCSTARGLSAPRDSSNGSLTAPTRRSSVRTPQLGSGRGNSSGSSWTSSLWSALEGSFTQRGSTTSSRRSRSLVRRIPDPTGARRRRRHP